MKKLTLKDIKSGALMGKPELVTVQIKLNGEEVDYDTYVLPFSYGTAVAQMKAYGENKEALAGVLASVICDEKGKLTFTEDEIRTLFNQALVDAMWSKIVEINVLGKAAELNQDDEILIEISIALGKTYSEVADLPYREIKKYTAYIRKYGSLNLGRRFEQELARIHQSVLMLKGVKDVKLHDLMTHEEKPESEMDEFDFED